MFFIEGLQNQIRIFEQQNITAVQIRTQLDIEIKKNNELNKKLNDYKKSTINDKNKITQLLGNNKLLTTHHNILQKKYYDVKNNLNSVKNKLNDIKNKNENSKNKYSKNKYKKKIGKLKSDTNLFKDNLMEIIGANNTPYNDEELLDVVRTVVGQGELAIKYNKELVNISKDFVTGVGAIKNINNGFGNLDGLFKKINNFAVIDKDYVSSEDCE